MSFGGAISNDVDHSTRDEPAPFDDDDPFDLPPPLPPLSPQREDDGTNQNGDVQGDQDGGEGDKKESNTKRKIKRSPRPKLDEVRLCGDRGIPALNHLCDGIKFKGKGHEASDLKLLIQRYEHWAHRLFPKFPFADVVDQVEKLGGKKLVQNCIKRIRRGEDDTVNDGDKSDTELALNGVSQDDGIPPATPVANNIQPFGVQVEPRNGMVILTPEQQERMRLNRERALAKRKAAQEEQAAQGNTQTNDQTTIIEEPAQSTDVVETAKDDDGKAGNLDMENDSSVRAEDVEMSDDNVDKIDQLLVPNVDARESVSGAEIDTDMEGSTSMGSAKEIVNQKEIEIANTETTTVLERGNDIAQNRESDPIAQDTIINDGTKENDFLGSSSDLPTNKDDANLAAVPLEEETPSSSQNNEASRNDGPQGTLETQPTEQAPSENVPGGDQDVEMETES